MKNEVLTASLCNNAREVKNHMGCIKDLVKWLDEHLPREEELKEQSKVMFDCKGEVLLFYNGIYYSWEIIVSILRKQEVITIDSLYDVAIN